MKTISPKALIVTALLFTPLLQAQTTTPPPTSSTSTPTTPPPPTTFPSTIPENGLWWSPQDSGTSYSITTQNNELFIVVNTYDQSGNPAWFTGSVQIPATSPESDGSNILAIDLLESTGGSCLSCPHQAPQTSNSQIQIFLSFSDQGHGQLTIDNKQIDIVPFNFNHGQGIARLEGAWEINYLSPSINIGGLDLIGTIFQSATLDSNSGNLVGASILPSNNNTLSLDIVLIHQTADPDMYLIINQQGFSAQFRIGIYVLEGLNRLIGVYALANSADSPQGIVDQLTANPANPPPGGITANTEGQISRGSRINNVNNLTKAASFNGPLTSIASKIDPFLNSATLANIKSLLLSLINQDDL